MIDIVDPTSDMTTNISFIPLKIIEAMNFEEKYRMMIDMKLVRVDFKLSTNSRMKRVTIQCQSNLNYVDEKQVEYYINTHHHVGYPKYVKTYPIITISGALKMGDIDYYVDLDYYANIILDGYVWIYIHDD